MEYAHADKDHSFAYGRMSPRTGVGGMNGPSYRDLLFGINKFIDSNREVRVRNSPGGGPSIVSLFQFSVPPSMIGNEEPLGTFLLVYLGGSVCGVLWFLTSCHFISRPHIVDYRK